MAKYSKERVMSLAEYHFALRDIIKKNPEEWEHIGGPAAVRKVKSLPLHKESCRKTPLGTAAVQTCAKDAGVNILSRTNTVNHDLLGDKFVTKEELASLFEAARKSNEENTHNLLKELAADMKATIQKALLPEHQTLGHKEVDTSTVTPLRAES